MIEFVQQKMQNILNENAISYFTVFTVLCIQYVAERRGKLPGTATGNVQ